MTDDFEAVQARLKARSEAAKAQAAANRERAPEFTRFVDDFKRVFGTDVKVGFVRWPDGMEQGKSAGAGVPVSINHITEDQCPKKARSPRSKRS